jgi:predicted RNA-binding Zn-ribbon protein involved in translation (DUF1610 family)
MENRKFTCDNCGATETTNRSMPPTGWATVVIEPVVPPTTTIILSSWTSCPKHVCPKCLKETNWSFLE